MERSQPDRLEEAKHLFRTHFEGRVIHTETDELINVFDANFETLEELDMSGVYEHYKSSPDSRKLYYVDSVKRDNVSGECLVLYTPLYEMDNFSVYARPLGMFIESVEVDGEAVARFRPISAAF